MTQANIDIAAKAGYGPGRTAKECIMLVLPYLYAVATNPNAKIEGNFARRPAVQWIYANAFAAVMRGPGTTICFRDGDAWTETPNPSPFESFQGDVGELAERLTLGDLKLGEVLAMGPSRGNVRRFKVNAPRDLSAADVASLSKRIDVPVGYLFEASYIDGIRAALEAWSDENQRVRLARATA